MPGNIVARRAANRRRLMGRPISQGREVLLSHFPLRPYRMYLEALGWMNFVLAGGEIYPSLVYEFYHSFEYRFGMVSFLMFERFYSYTLYEFAQLLGIPCVQDAFPEALTEEDMWRALCFEGVHYRTLQRVGVQDVYLREECVVPNKIIRSNVYHRDETDPTLSETEQRLLWCLMNGVPINVAHIVASRMVGLVYAPGRPLPYGALLTRLFRQIGEVIDGIPRHDISTRPIAFAINGESSEDET